MTKYLATVTITPFVGDAVTLTDTTSNAAASAAWAALTQRMDALVKDANGKKTLIPYHAVVKAEMTMATSTVEDPEDEFCTPVDDTPEEVG